MSIKAEPTFSLKDQLFNAESLGELSAGVSRAYPGFAREDFEREVLARFADLELKDRIRWIVTMLEHHLPADYPKAQDILSRVPRIFQNSCQNLDTNRGSRSLTTERGMPCTRPMLSQ